MTKVRIPVNQVDKYKSFCKSFSRHLETGTGIRLRGNALLNTIARAAGHDGHTALLLDARVYGNGPFRSELLPHQLAAPLAAQLELQPMQVKFMLGNALIDAYSNEIADAIRETTQYNPLAGVEPALPVLPDSEGSVWGEMSRCYLSSLAKTGAGQLPPDGGVIEDDDRPIIDFNDAVKAAIQHNGAVYIDAKGDTDLVRHVRDALLQIGVVEFIKAATHDLSKGETTAEAPFPIFLSDSGLCIEDGQSHAKAFEQSRSMSASVGESEIGSGQQRLDKGRGQ